MRCGYLYFGHQPLCCSFYPLSLLDFRDFLVADLVVLPPASYVYLLAATLGTPLDLLYHVVIRVGCGLRLSIDL